MENYIFFNYLSEYNNLKQILKIVLIAEVVNKNIMNIDFTAVYRSWVSIGI